MHVISANIGVEQSITNGKKTETTGIFKRPVDGPVDIGREGLPGDAVVDRENHGGPDQAVYIYGSGDYAWWAAEVGREFEPGAFGENLTIAGLECGCLKIGDRLQIAEVVLEVTAPRILCSTLAAKMGDPMFVKRFRFSERPGLYCRVIREGQVQAGDLVAVVPYEGESLTIAEMFRWWYEKDLDEATVRRHLAAPIAERSRAAYEARLRKLQGPD